MSQLHTAVFSVTSLKRCTFGRWKRRILSLHANGDVGYYSAEEQPRGILPRALITRIATAVPGEDPDPPHYANAHMLFVEITGGKKSYFVLTSYDDLLRWLAVIPSPAPTHLYGFVTSVNIPMSPARFEVTFDGIALNCAASLRVISFEELYCVFDCSLTESELNTCAILCHSENFICFFYDLRLRGELLLQLKRRALCPALFLELNGECAALLEREVVVQELRSRFNQFEREIEEVMHMPFNYGLSAPYVVVETLSHIAAHGCGLPGVFRVCGLASSITSLRNVVDSSQDIMFTHTPEDTHNACGLLKLFLRSTPSPILSDALSEVVASGDVARMRQVLSKETPPGVSCTLRYLFYVLHKIHTTTLSDPHDQAMSSANIATIFTAVVSPARGDAIMNGLKKYTASVRYLVENYALVWDSGDAMESILKRELSARRQGQAPQSRKPFYPTPEKLRDIEF